MQKNTVKKKKLLTVSKADSKKANELQLQQG